MSDRVSLSPEAVARIVALQFPQWSGRAIRPMEPLGWDNLTFRLGDDLVVRMPSAAGYVAQVAKEREWLPRLAPRLPLPVPTPIAWGRAGPDYPFAFSVVRWIEGTPGTVGLPTDLTTLGADLAGFLAALHGIDATDGPAAGADNFHRGGDLAVYDAETRAAIAALGEAVDGPLCLALWNAARATAWPHAPVWVHGDIAPGNLLFADDRLCAVIDFGCMGVGDPACDLAIAYTHLDAPGRAALQAGIGVDDDTLLRGRAWAVWKALITARDAPGDPGRIALVENIARA